MRSSALVSCSRKWVSTVALEWSRGIALLALALIRWLPPGCGSDVPAWSHKGPVCVSRAFCAREEALHCFAILAL